MWLEAIFSREDLQDVASKFAPLKILLGDSGSLLLVSPSEVSLIPNRGIALTCDATLHWPVLGVDIPVSMHGLLVHVLPTIEERPDGATLVFRLQIDHAGVAMLPSFFDHGITARVNEELQKKHVELAWNFVNTLSHAFGLPASLASAATFSVRATAGRVKVTETALALAVDFVTSVQTRDGGATEGLSTGGIQPAGATAATPDDGEAPPRGPSPTRSALDSRSLAVGAGAAWLLVAGLRAVRGSGKRRERWLA